MGELYNPFPKLPKNIRQIGERDSVAKLYVEDYVNTYLKRLYPQAGQDLRAGLLLGSLEMNDGTPYLFIDGAMEMEGVTEEGCKVEFSELAWKKAYQNMEQLFPKREIQGWFLCGAPGCELTPLNYWKQHVQYFQGPNKLMYLNCGAEGEESIYITSEDGFYKLKGHNIYYERNQMMQDYMVLRKDVKRIETGDDDKVIREFRRRMDEHKDAGAERRQSMGLMRGLTTAMSVVILAGGIVMFNNYQKMKEMESVITSALPEKAESVVKGQKDPLQKDKLESGLIIEEVEDGLSKPAGETMQQNNGGSQTGQAGGQTGQMNQNTAGGEGAIGNGSSENAADGKAAAGNTAGADTTGGDSAAGDASAASNPSETEGNASGGSTTSGGASSPQSGNGNGGTTQSAPSSKPVSVPEGARIHVIQDGETLYGICLAEYHDINRLKEIVEINGLENENEIVSGRELILP